ncbi:hypothetical protein BC833DRAFT_395125 [Globomyces pollinis-pini]|nr:hypothetical protein BC833DRAFT_395125 [Globomyces pollinis-pini]
MKPIGPPPPIQTHKPKQNNESKVRFTVLANHLNIQDLMDLPFNPLTEMKQLEIELDQNQSSQSELELTHQFGNFKNQLINDNMKTSVEMEPVKIEQNNQKNSHRGGMILNISKENLPILNSLVKVSQESLELDDSNNDSVQALDKRVDDTITNGKQQESKANSSVRDIKPSSTNNEGKTDTINKPFQIAIKSSLTKSFSLENIKMKVNKKLNPNKLNPLQISLEAPKLAEKSASLPAIVVTPPPTASKLHHEIPSPDINNKPIQLNTNKLTSMSATSNARKGQMKIHEQWVSFKGPKDSIATKKWLRIQKGLMSVYETDKELVSNLEIKLDNQINMLDVTMDEMGNSGVSFSIRDDTYSIFGKQNDVTPFRKIFINSRN